MFGPKNREEAEQYKYGAWAGKPQGNRYDKNRCAYEVASQGRLTLFYQCSRKPGFGTDGIFCKQHAKMIDYEA